MEINLKTWQCFSIFAFLFFAVDRGTVLLLAGVCCFVISGASAIVAAIVKRPEF